MKLKQAIPALPAPPKCGALPDVDSVIPLTRPPAPGQIAGANIVCLTNYYELKLGNRSSAVYFCVVKISKVEKDPSEQKPGAKPKKPAKAQGAAARAPRRVQRLSRRLNKEIFAGLKSRDVGDQLLAYDGGQRACGLKKIPNDSVRQIVEYDGDKWLVELTYDKAVPLAGLRPGSGYGTSEEEEEGLLALSLMVGHMPSLQFAPIGRGYYGLPGEKPVPLSGGLELWSGFKMHIIPGADRLYLNVNYAITPAVRSGPIIDFLPEMLRIDLRSGVALRDSHIRELKEKLSRCRGYANHLPVTSDKKRKTFAIATITAASAAQLKFDYKGTPTTVAQYFATQHNPLRFPNLPCVQVGQGRPTYFPLEHVNLLPANPYRGEQSSQLVSEIIKLAAIPPRNRLEEIRFAIKTLKSQTQLDREFDMEIGEELRVPGRILPPPTLYVGGNRTVRVNPGVIEFRGTPFYRGSSIKAWTVIVMDDRTVNKDVVKFTEVLVQQGRAVGIQIANPADIKGNFHAIDQRISMDKVEESLGKFGE